MRWWWERQNEERVVGNVTEEKAKTELKY